MKAATLPLTAAALACLPSAAAYAAPGDDHGEFIIFLLFMAALLYFLPFILGVIRRKANLWLLFLLNAAFGWTLVCWCVCFYLGVAGPSRRQAREQARYDYEQARFQHELMMNQAEFFAAEKEKSDRKNWRRWAEQGGDVSFFSVRKQPRF